MGHGDSINYQQPKEVEYLHGIHVVKIVSGNYHSVALSNIGQIYSWGSESNGGLGLGNHKYASNIPRLIITTHFTHEIKSIFCGPDCSSILLENGEFYSCGKNTNNKLGFGVTVGKSMFLVSRFSINSNNLLKPFQRKVKVLKKPVKDLSFSELNSAYLIEGGYVVTLGDNSYGQRGLGKKIYLNKNRLRDILQNRSLQQSGCTNTCDWNQI